MAALLLVGLIFTACIAAILASWSKNAAAKKHGARGYEFGRRAGLGEAALDYIKRRTGVNNISLVMTYDGELDAKILAAVLRRAQAKYALFRAYLVNDDTARFKVLSFTPSLPAIPIARVSGDDWRQVFHAEVNTPFAPMAGYTPALYPLIRFVIITQPRNVDAKCVLHVTVDHRLADGFSAGIIFDELMKDYSAVASGRVAPDAPPAATVPLDPPTEELGPAWLMLPRLFLKLLALALYVAVFVWRFRGFTRLPLRMSAASEAPPPTPPPRSDSPAHTNHPSEAQHAHAPAPAHEPAASASASLGADLTPSSSGRSLEGVWIPEPPAVVRGLSHLSGLFLHREPSVQGTLRVPWTTAAVFRTLSEAQTAALLAACKRERVTITAALFAAMSVAIAEKEIKAGTAKFPLLIYSYTLLDLRKLSRKFLNPIRLGLHISSIFSIASLVESFDEAGFWQMCRKYHADKNRSFMLLEPWRNLLLQWLLAHAAVFISMCNFYRGAGRKLINWLGKSIPSLSPTFAISNMGSLDHFQWTKRGPRLPNTPVVKEIYGAATVPVSWPFCLLLSSSVNGCLKLNFAFAPQALPFAAVESLAERVMQLLDAVATKHVPKDAAKDVTNDAASDATSDTSATPA